MSLYVPLSGDARDWCDWTGNSWDKIRAVVGDSFRVCGRHENVYTMAANAVLRLIRQNDIDPQRDRLPRARHRVEHRQRGRRGDRARHGRPRARGAAACRACSRTCEVPEFKHACLGGVYALKSARALRRRATARDQLGDRGLRRRRRVRARQRAASRRRARARSRCCRARAQAVRGRPRARGQRFGLPRPRLPQAVRAPLHRGLRRRRPRASSDFPVFSGKYSTFSYLDETVHAVEDMLRRLGCLGRAATTTACTSLFFHRPYHLMPVQAMSLPLRARPGARRSPPATSCARCAHEAQVSRRRRDARSTVVARPVRAACSSAKAPIADPVRGDQRGRGGAAQEARVPRAARAEDEPRRRAWCATSATCTRPRCRRGSPRASRRAPSRGSSSPARPMVAVGYGSGDAAEAIPITPVRRLGAAAASASAQAGARGRDRPQPRAIRERCTTAAKCRASTTPRTSEFVITHVGEQLRAGASRTSASSTTSTSAERWPAWLRHAACSGREAVRGSGSA